MKPEQSNLTITISSDNIDLEVIQKIFGTTHFQLTPVYNKNEKSLNEFKSILKQLTPKQVEMVAEYAKLLKLRSALSEPVKRNGYARFWIDV